VWSAIAPVVGNKLVLQVALVFLGYFLAGKLGQATTNIRSGNLGPVWPASGIALAGVLAYGPRVWPGIFGAAFLVALGSPVSAVTAFGQAAGATLTAVAGGFLMSGTDPFNPIPRLRSTITFIVFGALASSTIAATLGTASLYATGYVPYTSLMSAWLIYWLGDATGVLLITPLALACPSLSAISARRIATELTPLMCLTIGTCFIVFGDVSLLQFRPHGLALGVLPLVIWAAISFGIGGAALSVFVVAAMATVFTALGSGPFAVNTAFVNAVLLDVLFVVLAVAGLVFAAVIGEREQAVRERERLIRDQAAMEGRLRLAAVVDSSNDAVMTMTLDGIVQSWNASAHRILGWSEEEVVGRRIGMLASQHDRAETMALLRRLNAGHRVDPLKTTRLTKAGEVVDVVMTLSPIKDGRGNLIGAAHILRDVTQERRTAEALSRLSGRLITAQEQERNRIARELHDDIAQRLALLATNLTGLAAEAKSAPAAQAQAAELQRHASELAGDVQQLSHRLHSSRLDLLGLTAATKHFCRDLSQQHKAAIDFEASEVPEGLSSAVSLCLFRILQEALHNAVKHSGSRQYEVRLRRVYDDLEVMVADHGDGFDIETATNNGGIGLISMQERVKLVGGALLIESRPGQGTTIRARVPIPPSAAG
jgi:PAS domain S-box-containing protein